MSRQQQREVAHELEVARNDYRGAVLDNDFVLQSAVSLLKKVRVGRVPIERVVDLGPGDTAAKDSLLEALPGELAELGKLLTSNCRDFAALTHHDTAKEDRPELWQIIRARRRELAAILERFDLRTIRLEKFHRQLVRLAERMAIIAQ